MPSDLSLPNQQRSVSLQSFFWPKPSLKTCNAPKSYLCVCVGGSLVSRFSLTSVINCGCRLELLEEILKGQELKSR